MPHWCKIGAKLVPRANPKLLNLNQDHPSKKRFFWPHPYKIEVLIEKLESLVTRPHLQYKLNHVIKFCWWRHGQKFWRHNFLFQNTFISRRSGAAIFADIIKIVTMFIKTLRKVKRIRNYVSKWNLYQYFLI